MEQKRREARRRRLSETGADRLAFITGRIDSLPRDHSFKTASQPTVDESSNENAKAAVYARSESLPAVSSLQKSLSDASTFTKSPPLSSVVEDSSSVPSIVENSPSISSIVENSPSVSSIVENSPSVSSVVQNSPEAQDSSSSASHSVTVVQPQPSCQIFSVNHLKSCISVSENIRLFSSIIIAIWVVLSYCGFLSGSGIVKSTPLGPMYLVLLSDAAIVFGLLLIGCGRNQDNEAGSKAAKNADDWLEKVGGPLDHLLLVHKVTVAAVMDCCVYAAILISGLSLLQ